MRLKQANALAGWGWTRDGLLLVKQQPLTLSGLIGFMFFGLGLLLSLPWIGPVLVALLLPALSAGWVEAVEQMRQGKRPPPWTLGVALAPARRMPMLQLGALHAVAGAAVLGLAELLDPGLIEAWRLVVTDGAADDASRLAAFEALQYGMLLRLALLTPVMLLFWHAPVILLREGGSVAKALFGSALASFRNLGAFTVYGLAWVGVDLALSAVLGTTLALLGLAQFAFFFAMPAALLFSAAFYASLHASVHGCLDFSGEPAGTREDAPPTDTGSA